VVTFSYSSRFKSDHAIPIGPVLFALRSELDWGDVVRNYYSDEPRKQSANGSLHVVGRISSAPFSPLFT
jgi:hypothetical protein